MINKRKLVKINFMISIFILLFQVGILPVESQDTYTKSWVSNKGSRLRIEIARIRTEFETGKSYSFGISVEALEFTLNQDRFHTIEISLRFLNTVHPIVSGPWSLADLNSIGDTSTIDLLMAIPSDDILDLSYGDSINGQLQYLLTYKEGLILESDTSLSTQWNTITAGEIVRPSSSTILGFILVGVIGLGVYLLYRKGKKDSERRQQLNMQKPSPPKVRQPSFPGVRVNTPVTSMVPNNTHLQRGSSQNSIRSAQQMKFCMYCGEENLGEAQYCENCGKNIAVNTQNEGLQLCTNCNTKLSLNESFCTNCGLRV